MNTKHDNQSGSYFIDNIEDCHIRYENNAYLVYEEEKDSGGMIHLIVVGKVDNTNTPNVGVRFMVDRFLFNWPNRQFKHSETAYVSGDKINEEANKYAVILIDVTKSNGNKEYYCALSCQEVLLLNNRGEKIYWK